MELADDMRLASIDPQMRIYKVFRVPIQPSHGLGLAWPHKNDTIKSI